MISTTSSRRYPFVAFLQNTRNRDDLIEVENISKTIDGKKNIKQ